MMDRGDQWYPSALQFEHTIGNSLIVVDNIKLTATTGKPLLHTLAKRIRLRESTREFAEPLNALKTRQ
jgi:hypothetical protein